MKIIQIIVKKDTIYGLCDEGQLWCLEYNMWVLVPIEDFVHPEVNESWDIIQDNDLKINLTGG